MKKILFFFCMIFALHAETRAQNYFPFPTDSARWQVTFSLSVFGCTSTMAVCQYQLNGDTMISNTTYHKLYKVSYTSNSSCINPGNGYAGCIREDSAKHVFIRFPSFTADSLLYDFNLQVGDTAFTWNDCCHDAVVTSIDSVLIGSSWRKRFNISTGFFCGLGSQSIIEGIGSTSGLLECFSYSEMTTNLNCFWERGQTLYPNSSAPCPPMITGISTPENNFVFTVSPNPSKENIRIRSSAGFEQMLRLQLYDVFGKQVYTEAVNTRSEELLLRRNALGAGYYFIVLTEVSGMEHRFAIGFVD